jgi:hypothetical protein
MLLLFILYVIPNFSKIVCTVMCFHPFWFGKQWHKTNFENEQNYCTSRPLSLNIQFS